MFEDKVGQSLLGGEHVAISVWTADGDQQQVDSGFVMGAHESLNLTPCHFPGQNRCVRQANVEGRDCEQGRTRCAVSQLPVLVVPTKPSYA